MRILSWNIVSTRNFWLTSSDGRTTWLEWYQNVTPVPPVRSTKQIIKKYTLT